MLFIRGIFCICSCVLLTALLFAGPIFCAKMQARTYIEPAAAVISCQEIIPDRTNAFVIARGCHLHVTTRRALFADRVPFRGLCMYSLEGTQKSRMSNVQNTLKVSLPCFPLPSISENHVTWDENMYEDKKNCPW